MKDVAEMAGVSKSTVSHVINETRFVEPDTKRRVLDAIEELGYRPSSVARSLTTNRTQKIGVLVSDTSNIFFGEIIRGIETVLGPLGYALIVCNTDETLERESAYLNLLMDQNVDGIIAAGTSHRWKVLEQAFFQQLPLVFMDRYFEGIEDFPFVGVDNHQGGFIGAEHLIECGYDRIGILAGFQRLSTMRDRLAGFLDAVERHQIQLPENWIVTSPLGVKEGYAAAEEILNQQDRPDALFISNNYLMLGALLAFQDYGLSCPNDIALVGFDDHPWAAVANPPLTVVRQPVTDLGHSAARLLLDLIEGKSLKKRRIIHDCELVIRHSCRPT